MEQLTQRLSQFMVRIGATTEDNREVVAYGLFLLLAGAEQILLLIAAAFLLKIPLHMALFVLCYAVLKRTIGGWHASSHGACLVGFTAIAVIGSLAGRYAPTQAALPAAVVLPVVTLAIIWQLAPVEHPNNPHRPEKIPSFRKLARWLALLECGLIWGVVIVGGGDARNAALSAALGGLTAAVTLLIPLPPPNEMEGGGSG